MVYKQLKALLSELTISMRNFIWADSVDHCFKPVKLGGFQIKKLHLFNTTLLARFVWRILTVDYEIFGFLRGHFLKRL